jgi:FAD/FMN-containing dehydrogenase
MLEPKSVIEACEMVRSASRLRIFGSGSKREFGCPIENVTPITTTHLQGITDWAPEDLVVVVKAGTLVADLQRELASRNQCLPIPPSYDAARFATAGFPGTVGGLVSANLPTRWDGVSRGARYWVLGMTIIRADGTTAKCGSRAVKNVAGYDAQKLFVGAWGTLGLITEVAFRVAPIGHTDAFETSWRGELPMAIVRGLPSQMADYLAHFDSSYLDTVTGTAWISVRAPVQPPADGWAIFAGLGQHSSAITNPDLQRAFKTKLDPDGKFNPGLMGAL